MAVSATVNIDGVVTAANVTKAADNGSDGLTADVTECIRKVVLAGPLHCPLVGNTSTVNIPLSFVAPQDAGPPVFNGGASGTKK